MNSPKRKTRNNVHNKTRTNSAPYTGAVLKQHMNNNALPKPQQFFVRALVHCYSELEDILGLISRTPYEYQKPLRVKKAKLQREAEYITSVKLKGYSYVC